MAAITQRQVKWVDKVADEDWPDMAPGNNVMQLHGLTWSDNVADH